MTYGEEPMVTLSWGGGDWAAYPQMELWTLFPVRGKLYCFDKIAIDDNGKKCVSAFRLEDAEMPPGVTVGMDTLIFPSVTPRRWRQDISGAVGASNKILVGRIEREGKTGGFVARILTADCDHLDVIPRSDDKILDHHWRVVRVSDVVNFGHYRYRFRVVNIIPLDPKGHMVRGHLCKRIGWIELDSKPVRDH
jgi:hypothetical protein